LGRALFAESIRRLDETFEARIRFARDRGELKRLVQSEHVFHRLPARRAIAFERLHIQRLLIAKCRILLSAAVLAGAAAAYSSESPIQIVHEEGKTVAQFKIGNARCVLIDDQIRCTTATK